MIEEGTRAASGLRLFNDMESLRRLLRLYPGGHPALEPARERIRVDARALAGDDGLTIGVAPDRIFLDGEEVMLPRTAPGLRLVQLLFHLGMASLRLRFPPATEGLVALAARLAPVHEPPGEADREALLADKDALAGVELVPLDLSIVQLVEGQAATGGGSRMLAAEVAGRLARDGVFQLAGKLNEGELSPGAVLELIGAAGNAESLFDYLFTQMAETLADAPESTQPVLLSEVRAFLDELVRLLEPERRRLAAAAAMRHLPVAGNGEEGSPALLSAELLLDAVELLLLREQPIPPAVARVIHRLAAPLSGKEGEVPAELVARARFVLTRMPAATPKMGETAGIPEAEEAPWRAAAFTAELTDALDENTVRLHLIRVLGEAITTWPTEPVADRAAIRLAEEFVSCLELGDFDTASRLAAVLAATRSADAHEIANRSGVEAAVRAFKTYERDSYGTISAILGSLGEGAVPALLEALASEQSMAVRKRLLEVIARHGEGIAPHVRPYLDDLRWYVVRNAIFLLRRVGDRDIAGLLKTKMHRARAQVMEEILKALVSLDDRDWPLLLGRELDSDDPERQLVAIRVAARIPHVSVVQMLADRLRARIGTRLREPSSVELIRALATLHHPAALPVLEQVLDLKQWRVPFGLGPLRKEAAVAIAQLSGPDARRLAEALARDRDADIAAAVRAAMHRQPQREAQE